MNPHPLAPSPAPASPLESAVAEPADGAGAFRMKYIRHRTLGFVLFENSVRHDDVAACLGGRDELLSAGFVFAPFADVRCVGHSTTLDLGPAPLDTAEMRARSGL